jgi:putative transposase
VILLSGVYSPFRGIYQLPDRLKQAIGRFVEHYNHQRYHESLNNVMPADVYFGRDQDILARREQTKRQTMLQRRRENQKLKVA